MKRKASAVWQGGLKDGKGSISSDSGVLKDTPFSFTTRFGEGITGTNPEDLIASAHAGCFSMAFSALLEKAGYKPLSVSTTASVSLDKIDENWSVTKVDLETVADVPGIGADQFRVIADEAKAGCPISRLLRAEISLDAKLKTKAVA